MRSPYRFALAGFAASALLVAGCSSSGSSSGSRRRVPRSTGPPKPRSPAGGGMSALIAAAKAEGTLNVIALPPTWANYGTIISAFEKKYGIKINSALPDGSSQQEVNAIKSENGSAQGARRRGRRPGRRAGQHQPVRAVPGQHLVLHPGRAEGPERAVVRGLRRLHGGRLLEQVRHDHLAEPAARPAVQERCRAERQPDLGQRGPERRHDGQPRRGRLGRQHRPPA